LAAYADGAAVGGNWLAPEHSKTQDAAQHRQNIRHRSGRKCKQKLPGCFFDPLMGDFRQQQISKDR
jgi:hypothetical protein